MIDVANKEKAGDIRNHLRRPFLLFCGIVLLGVLLVIFAPRKYQSEAKMFVRLGRESVGMDPTAAATRQPPAVSFTTERAYEIRSIVEMLQNRALFKQVATELTPEVVLEWKDYETAADDELMGQEAEKPEANRTHWTRYPSRFVGRLSYGCYRGVCSALGLHENDVLNDAVDHLADKIIIRSTRQSTVVCVSYRSPQPELSQAIVSTFVEAFLESHPKWNRVQESTKFFEEQVTLADRELNDAHTAFAMKKNELNVVSLATYPAELAKQLNDLEVELMSAKRQLDSERTKLVALQDENDTAELRVVTDVQSGIADAGRDAMRGQLYKLELDERALAARYRDSYGPLLAVRQQIEAARDVLQNTRDERMNTTKGLNPIRTETEKAIALQIPEVAAWEASVEKLESQHAELTQRADAFNQDEIELASLKRKVDLAESNFSAYATSWEESRVDHALQTSLISNVNVVQPATLQPDAVFPREMLSLLAITFFGLVVSGALLWYDLRKNAALQTPAQIATAISAPVLARFPLGRNPIEFDLTAEKH